MNRPQIGIQTPFSRRQRRRWPALPLALVLGLGWSGCKEQAPPAPEEVQASSLPAITITAKSKLLLTHATAEGTFTTVDSPDKVPEGRRGWVRVVDLAQKPEQRQDHELVYVADLRSPRDDGSYPYVVMSRQAFESAALGRARAGATDPEPAPGEAGAGAEHDQVILYSTAWCGACKAARAYLSGKGVPFVEKDIEKDSAASAELLRKARAAGISASGVPVIDVGGTLMQGFDRQRLDALLEGLSQRKGAKDKAS